MRCAHSALLSGLVLIPLTASAEVVFTPSVALGYKTVTFGAGEAEEVDVGMPTMGLGFAASIDRFTLQFNAEQSLRDGDYQESSEPLLIDSLVDDSSLVAEERYEGDVSRTDLNLTASFTVVDRVSIFVGYIDNTTEMEDLNIRFFDDLGGELVLLDDFGAIIALGGSVEQNDSGAVAGLRMVPLITQAGSLSTTLGYAWLDTETDVTVRARSVNASATAPTPTSEADTTGISASVSWVGPIPGVENLRYLGTLRLNRFTQEEEAGDINNDLTYVGAGLLYSL